MTADLITKEELVELVLQAGCKKMDGLPIASMDKDELMKHLQSACCPVISHLTKPIRSAEDSLSD